MSKLNYCINCGEAVEFDHFIKNLSYYETDGFFGKTGIKWENIYFAICVNEDCRLFGVMMRRIKETPPQRLTQQLALAQKPKKKVVKNANDKWKLDGDFRNNGSATGEGQ